MKIKNVISIDTNPAVAMPVAWERVRFITHEIEMMLNLLTAGDSLRPGVVSPDLIAVLLDYLKEVEGLRSGGEMDETGSLADAVWRDYRTILERMSRIVPIMEQQLLSDRSRLAQEQKRLSSTAAWNSTAKLTR